MSKYAGEKMHTSASSKMTGPARLIELFSIGLAAVIFFQNPLLADVSGSSGFNFLKVGVGARQRVGAGVGRVAVE